MSMLLAVSMLFPRTSSQEFFSMFSISSVSKLVNVAWDDERAFNQEIGTLLILVDFRFWDLISAAFSSSMVIFSYSCSFTF